MHTGRLSFGAVLLAVFVIPSAIFAQSISISDVTGKFGAGVIDTIRTDAPITCWLRFTNPEAISFSFTNGFVVYSPDGATWDTLGVKVTGAIPPTNFDLMYGNTIFHGSGGVDTVGIYGVKAEGAGLPANFNGVPYGIALGVVGDHNDGMSICIDSAFFQPGGTWKWTAPGGVLRYPSWSGPYCYTVYHLPCTPPTKSGATRLTANPDCDPYCCVSLRGNVSGDVQDAVDLTDIQALVDFLFFSQPISTSCFHEADVDASTAIDISDLSMLIDYMFFSGTLPRCYY